MMAVFSAARPFTHSKKLDTQENLLMFIMIKGTLGALAIIMPMSSNRSIARIALGTKVFPFGDALRIEIAPLDVHVITVVTGGIKSRVLRLKRSLLVDSTIMKLADEYQKRQIHG